MNEDREADRASRDVHHHHHYSKQKERGRSRHRSGNRPYTSYHQRRPFDRERPTAPESYESTHYRSRHHPSQNLSSRSSDRKTRHSRASPYGDTDPQAEDSGRKLEDPDDGYSRTADTGDFSSRQGGDRSYERKRKRDFSPHSRYNYHQHSRRQSPSGRSRESHYREKNWRSTGSTERHQSTRKRSPSQDSVFSSGFNPPRGPASSYKHSRGRSPSPSLARNTESRFDRWGSQGKSSRRPSPAHSSRHSVHSHVSLGSHPRSPSPPPLDDYEERSQAGDFNVHERRPSPPGRRYSLDSEGDYMKESDQQRAESFAPHNMREDMRPSRRASRQYDSRMPYDPSPRYSETTPRDVSPQPKSSYPGARNTWGQQQQPNYRNPQSQRQYSPPYRQGSYSTTEGAHGQYYQNQQSQYGNHGHPGYTAQNHRGVHSMYRGGHYNQAQDRRFSSQNVQAYGPPGQQQQRRQGFQSTHWMSAGLGRGQHPSAYHNQMGPGDDRMAWERTEQDTGQMGRETDSNVDDDGRSTTTEQSDIKKMPPPNRQSNSSTPAKEGSGKFSFAFKKAAPPTAPKPVPDLAQRMRDPPKPIDLQQRSQPRAPLAMRTKQDRDYRRDDKKDARARHERYYESSRSDRNDRRDESRRRDRREERRDDRMSDSGYERRQREPTPEKPKAKIIVKRTKKRPELSEEYASSTSVYFRKPGNESVIGAGTYGKVFKAVHVYTEQQVALKKIRMEGEKDGFPITAVREIRLLQYLRHDNIVRLLEVMVERNECFMVFEYLSHDLTGLINHPTFVLSAAHKKDLARQMFEGLNYLHHRGVLHRDIKAANILISNRGLLKFADFGLARFFSKSRQLDYTNRVITIWYRPPELLLGETRYGPAVDVWSAACVWMEMFTRKAVFPGDGGEISQIEKLYNMLGTPTKSDWPDILDMPWFELLRPSERKKRVFDDTYRDVLSPAALDLVSKMFLYDPAKRPSAEEVLNHPYFTTEEPAPAQATELEDSKGDWHEFESKAARRERDKELRREYFREKEKRRGDATARPTSDRDTKRMKVEDDAFHSSSRLASRA